MKSLSKGSLLLLILILAVVILGIPDLRAEIKPRLAILPFLIERESTCPLCKRISTKGEIQPGSQKRVTRLLQHKIEDMETFEVVPLDKMEKMFSRWEKGEFEERIIPSAIQMGRDLNLDFIFIGFLFRFEERIGSSLGVEKPASVSFDFHLIRFKDGKIIWGGRLDETQRALSENLFKIGSFFRRKASWLTAEELADVGMGEALRELPSPKELEEQP